MSGLAASRCFHHELREAVARCPSCSHFFCRECVVVFEDRLICSSCLMVVSASAPAEAQTTVDAFQIAFVVLGFVVTWFCFYAAGWLLLLSRDKAPLS